MFAFPRSFFLTRMCCYCACFFRRRRDAGKIIWFITFLFFFSLLLCSNNSSSSATTIIINYKMIKSTQSIRIASFFPFFSLSDDCARAVKPSFIYIYIYRMNMCFLACIRNDWPQRSFQYSRASRYFFFTYTRVIVSWHSKKNKSMLFF
jgi:hypothetical protein